MSPSPTEIEPGRLWLVASAFKREALSLASEWGTPLARIPPVVDEAFQSPFGEAARHAISGWERDLNDLGNHLFRLSSACEAAADEEEQIAKVVAGGFPPPTRHQDAASAFVAWERRSRQRRPFVPPAGGVGGGFVAIVPERIRLAAQALLDARDELGASYQRLFPLAMSDSKPPRSCAGWRRTPSVSPTGRRPARRRLRVRRRMARTDLQRRAPRRPRPQRGPRRLGRLYGLGPIRQPRPGHSR